MQTVLIEYSHDDVLLEAFVAHSDHKKRPAVLIVHDWSGRGEFVQEKAKKLAELGYVGIAIDMYGKGKIGTTREENMALMSPVVSNPTLLQARLKKALAMAKSLPYVDAERVAIMGYCFGGACALELARIEPHLQGAISFHGLLTPFIATKNPISAKLLVLHGHDDPMVPPAQVEAFEQEMTEKKADWQLHVYGNTMHSFTNPLANDPAFGTVYSPSADYRSWIALKDFLVETFA